MPRESPLLAALFAIARGCEHKQARRVLTPNRAGSTGRCSQTPSAAFSRSRRLRAAMVTDSDVNPHLRTANSHVLSVKTSIPHAP